MNKLKFYEYENMEDFFYRHEGTTVIQATGEDAEDYFKANGRLTYENCRSAM